MKQRGLSPGPSQKSIKNTSNHVSLINDFWVLGTIARAVSRIEARLGRQESAKDISWDVGFETPAGVIRGGSGNHDQVAQSYRETMTITPNAKIISPLQRTAETKTVYAPLGKGPAFQLGRAAAGEDESRRAGLCHTLLNLPGIKQQDGDGVEKVDVPKTRRDLAD